jgi:adenylosuccinate synthase
MSPEFVNVYIETLFKEIEELMKNNVFMKAQLKFSEATNISLNQRIVELEKQLEKKEKRINKKEVNTSDTDGFEQ